MIPKHDKRSVKGECGVRNRARSRDRNAVTFTIRAFEGSRGKGLSSWLNTTDCEQKCLIHLYHTFFISHFVYENTTKVEDLLALFNLPKSRANRSYVRWRLMFHFFMRAGSINHVRTIMPNFADAYEVVGVEDDREKGRCAERGMSSSRISKGISLKLKGPRNVVCCEDIPLG